MTQPGTANTEYDEEMDLKKVPISMWRCIKNTIHTLIDSKVTDKVKRDVGQLLLRNISLLEKQSTICTSSSESKSRGSASSSITSDGNQESEMKKYLIELREQIFEAVDKILMVANRKGDSSSLCDDTGDNIIDPTEFWERIAQLEDKITITDNVNNNFRKILKLENDFLRDLLHTDRQAIKRLHLRIELLQKSHIRQSKFAETMDENEDDEIPSPSSSIASQSSTETVIENQLKIVNPNRELVQPTTGKMTTIINPAVVSVSSSSSAPVFGEQGNFSPLMECVIDLISRGMTKEEILKLFRCIRGYRETN